MSRKLTAGSTLAQYKIVKLLGEGGMGAVYEALDESLDRHVAIKTLLSEVAQDQESRKRFFREGKAAAKLRHPHVVEVYGVGIEDEIPYLVMELLSGESLASLLDRERSIAPERALDILLPVLSALVVAHQEGVIHRDLKPDNIFLQQTRAKTMVPKLLDFGISKVTGAHNSRITHTSALMGTPYYMSPEQARGSKDVDPQIDQWSMGVIMYEALAGERPITGDTVLEILHRIATLPIRPLLFAAPEVPQGLAEVVMRALDRDPAKRWPSIAAFARALLPFATPPTRATWEAAFERMGSERPPARATSDSGESSAEQAAVRPPPKNDVAETIAASPRPRAEAGRGSEVPATRAGAAPDPEPPASEAVSERPKTETVHLPTASRAPLVLGGIAIVALLGIGIALANAGTTSSDAPPATAPPATAPPATAPPATAPPPTSPPATTPEPPTPEPPPPAPATFAAALRVTPASATISLDGSPAATGQWTATLPRDGRTHTLRVEADGYQSAELTFTDEAPSSELALERARRTTVRTGSEAVAGSASGGAASSMTSMTTPQAGANGSVILE